MNMREIWRVFGEEEYRSIKHSGEKGMIYCHCCRKPFKDVESVEFIPLPEIGVYAV